MTERKFTDEQIIKALKRCILCNAKQIASCKGCYLEKYYPNCDEELEIMCLDLINRQRAEIERLSTLAKLGNVRANDYRAMRDQAKNARAEAIKEFAARLVSKVNCIPQHHFTLAQVLYDIDTLVKEMTGGK